MRKLTKKTGRQGSRSQGTRLPDAQDSGLRTAKRRIATTHRRPNRAEDSLARARIVFGTSFINKNMLVEGNINVNTPLVYDVTMTGALRTYAAANQGNVISPFILSVAMSPVTQTALLARSNKQSACYWPGKNISKIWIF